jgi:SAM-dependent methyltransferase
MHNNLYIAILSIPVIIILWILKPFFSWLSQKIAPLIKERRLPAIKKTHLIQVRKLLFSKFSRKGAKGSLLELGLKHKTDKAYGHDYCLYYEEHLAPLRNKNITLLEIGVYKGASLRMWEEYFPKAKIYGIDINPDCKQYESKRTKIFIGDQADTKFLKEVCKKIGGRFDVIIDDGGHHMKPQQVSFVELFNTLKAKGIYIIEDLATSYEDKYGGGTLTKKDTTMTFIKGLIDVVNFPIHRQKTALTQLKIESLHTYPEICFIKHQ